MFNYPELVRLSIILCVSALIFGFALRSKKFTLAQHGIYFSLLALLELLNLSAFYFGDDPFIPLKYIILIFLFLFYQPLKKLSHSDFSLRFYFSTIISIFWGYSLFEIVMMSSLIPRFEIFLDGPVGFGYFLFVSLFIWIVIPVALFIIIFEKITYKGKFTNSFSYVNFILTPLAVVILVGVFQINGALFYANVEVLSHPRVINGIQLEPGSTYYYSKDKLNEYLEINSESGKSISWHNMLIKSLNRAEFYSDYEYSGNNTLYVRKKYDYLNIRVENDQLIHNRLCDKTEPLKFRFLSDNYDDWSEQNTEFVSCKLVADTPLNQMRILNNLGDEITLTYKPLQNNNTHPKKLYQDFNLFPYIKWHWEVNKAINLFPNIKSEITDLYLDDNRNLMALLIENEIENDNAENVILDNQCTLSRSEFRKMLILNVGSNPVTASFPKLSNEQKCTPQQLELYIDKKAIFDD